MDEPDESHRHGADDHRVLPVAADTGRSDSAAQLGNLDGHLRLVEDQDEVGRHHRQLLQQRRVFADSVHAKSAGTLSAGHQI